MLRMNSSESLEVDSTLSESGEPDIAPKIVKVSEKGFFASWFNTVDPNAPVREDEYFWPSGLPLEQDNFEGDELDNYLSTSPKSFDAVDELQPLSLDDIMSVTSDDSVVEMLSIASDVSDWTEMPPVLPPLGDIHEAVDDLIPVPIMRKVSDWSEMPPLLPPLPGTIEAAPLKREKSDWTKMPPILPPLELNPIAPPPMIPQYSSDWSEMPDPLLPLDLVKNRSRPMEFPTHSPEIMAPAPLVSAVSEPALARSIPMPTMVQPAVSWNPTSTFVPFASNDNVVNAIECQNMVPDFRISSPTQQFVMPLNLPHVSWQGDQDDSVEFLEPEWDYKESTNSPDQILDYDVQCDHGSLIPCQSSSDPTVLNQNVDLTVTNPETALVLLPLVLWANTKL